MRAVTFSALRSLAAAVVVAMIAAFVAVAPAAGAPVPPATDDVHTCGDGEVIDRVLPGNLLVPAGVSCSISVGAVRGRTEVLGYLATYRATLKKPVTVHPAGELVVGTSTLWGWVVLHRAARVTAFGSTLVGSIVGSLGPSPQPGDFASLDLTGVDIRGSVDITGSGFDGHRLSVGDSVIDGALRWKGAHASAFGGRIGGSVDLQVGRRAELCGTSIGGDLTVHGVRGWPDYLSLAIGSPEYPCGRATAVAGDLVLTGNTAGQMAVDEVTVGGDLVCTGNAPVPTITAIEVAGARLGQCALP